MYLNLQLKKIKSNVKYPTLSKSNLHMLKALRKWKDVWSFHFILAFSSTQFNQKKFLICVNALKSPFKKFKILQVFISILPFFKHSTTINLTPFSYVQAPNQKLNMFQALKCKNLIDPPLTSNSTFKWSTSFFSLWMLSKIKSI